MQIIILTRGRTGQQITLQKLPRELRERTWIVCPRREASGLYRFHKNIVVEPHPMKLAEKRGWIVQEWFRRGYEKILMLDDDLVFSTRISADDWHLREIQSAELIPGFQRIEDKLGPEFPHVGFGQRQGNNRLEEVGWKSPAKQVCTLGYYLPVVAKEVRWDLVELRQDMCATLQLLLKGFPNAIWTETVVDQKRDAPGGCSIYRTDEMSDAEAWKFKRLFPEEYVSVVPREYNSGTRLEPRVQWQKALEDGQRHRSQLEKQITLV
jgi:hypothetical protein